MVFDDVKMYKRKKRELEAEKGRSLTNDEKRELYDSILDYLWRDSKVPEEETSDLEITGLKD